MADKPKPQPSTPILTVPPKNPGTPIVKGPKKH